MAALLEAQLLSRESPAKAIAFMQDFVTAHPEARDLQLNLARVLISEKRYGEARVHFDQLLKDYPDKPEIVHSVALLAFQQNDLPFAESLLKKLLVSDVPDKTPFNYYLGQIAEEGKRSDEALAYYAKVVAGEQFFPARAQRPSAGRPRPARGGAQAAERREVRLAGRRSTVGHRRSQSVARSQAAAIGL